MHLDPSFVGTTLRKYKTTVSWRSTMNYAAAVNDPNEAYFDDERPGGVIAHPINCAALTWPITERIHEFIESDNFPKELLLRQVHFTEHIELHRPVVPGDELLIRGRIAAIEPHRAGTHVIIRFAAEDREGVPVFTEHIGGLMRGVECVGAARGVKDVPPAPKASSSDIMWESPVKIDRLAPFIYDGCTDIYFPIHTSKKFARALGLPDIILQGTATLAFAIKELINKEAFGDPARVSKIYCKFTGMVMPGSEIKIQQTGCNKTSSGTDIFFQVLNSEGLKAVNNGYMHIK